MSITLNTITNPDRLSLINSNFSKIAQAINESLLWRNGNTAGETLLTRDVDFNSNQILNAYVGEYALSDVVTVANGAQEAADEAAQSASSAAQSASIARSLTPYYSSGSFAVGATVTSEYQTLLSGTDEFGNAYQWAYIGPKSNFPLFVSAGSSPDQNWALVITGEFKIPLEVEQTVTSVVSITPTTVTYSVTNPAAFIVGKYAFIYATTRSALFHCGVFQVTAIGAGTITVSQSNAKITATGATLLGPCKVRPMNFSVYAPGGITISGFVKNIEGVLMDGQGTASYGIRTGGSHDRTGIRRDQGSIGSMSFCAFVNLRRSGATTDDVVGILVANGTSVGVNNVAVNGSKIGIETYRNGSLIGEGAYVYDISNDAFKAEFTCNNYLYYCAAIKCGSGYTARYSSGGEYATIVCSDASYGSVGQFNGYCSVRDFEFYGMTSAGHYATQEGYVLINTGECVNCSYSYRARKGGQIEQLSSTSSVTDTNSANGYDISSSRLLLLNAVVTSGAANSWDGVGDVNINGEDHAFAQVTLSATVPANGRQAWQATFKFNFNETNGNKIRLGVRYSDSALPIGLLIPTPALFNTNSSRIYAINYTAAPIVVNMAAFAYVF